jgi:putative DNA primase/helicase
MEVESMVKNIEEIHQKKPEDCTVEDLRYLRKCEEYFDQKFAKTVTEIYECANNFKRPPVVDVAFEDRMNAYMDQLFFRDGDKILYLVDKLGIEDKIEFIKDYAITDREYDKIYIGNKDLTRISNQIWAALIYINRPQRIFQFRGQIIRLLFVDGIPTIQYLNKYQIRHVLETAADFIKLSNKSEYGHLEVKLARQEPVSPIAYVPDYPDSDICEHILSDPNPPLPVLEQIKYKPYFALDGELIFMPGYSEKTRCYLHDPKNILVPNALRPSSLDEAKRLLFEEVRVDFPLVKDSDRAHTIALLIQPFVRQMIQGPTPLHIVNSPSPGTGKGLLVQALTYIATGQPIEFQAMPGNDEEIRKRLTSKLMKLPTFVAFDNVNVMVDSASLSLAITAPVWEDRVLGKSKIISLPVCCTWLLTGNNVQCSSEIARRSIRIHMDTELERPWQREEFHQSDLMKYVRDNCELLMWAAITLVEHWIKNGKKKFSGKPLGGFESWSEITGGILEAAGIKGFLEDMDAFYDDADDETKFLNKLIYLWHETFDDKRVQAKDLTSLDIQINNSRMLAAIIGNHIDKKIGDFKIKRGKKKQGIWTYYLVKDEKHTLH